MMNLKKCFPAGLRFYTSTLVLFQRAFAKKKKKKRRTIEKKKKVHRYVLRDIHKKTRKKCVLNVKYITVHYIVIKQIFLTSLFFIQGVLFGTYGFYNNRNACLTFLLP